MEVEIKKARNIFRAFDLIYVEHIRDINTQFSTSLELNYTFFLTIFDAIKTNNPITKPLIIPIIGPVISMFNLG